MFKRNWHGIQLEEMCELEYLEAERSRNYEMNKAYCDGMINVWGRDKHPHPLRTEMQQLMAIRNPLRLQERAAMSGSWGGFPQCYPSPLQQFFSTIGCAGLGQFNLQNKKGGSFESPSSGEPPQLKE